MHQTWEPENLFYQLRRVLKDHCFELVDETENTNYEVYDISISVDGAKESVAVATADSSHYFDTFNNHLSRYQFVRLVSHPKERRTIE